MEECIICFEETTEFSFYRCAHKVCNTCYPKLRTCPVCKTPNELEVIIIRPSNRAEYVMTTHDMIRNVGLCFFLSGMCFVCIRIFFYRA